jgi:microcystin degradation protein MlrC
MASEKHKRVALLGLHLESNAFAPVATEADFRSLCYLAGDAILAEARKAAPAMPVELPSFIAEMDKAGPWTPMPILVTGCEPAGPIDHGFLLRLLADMNRRLQAALPLDAVYISNHGGMTSTGTPDPDGLLYKMVRDTVGPRVPIVATIDLHANISETMVDTVDVIVSYRTNPHVDQAERAAEAARLLQELMGGVKAHAAFIRLPLTPASISLLTAAGPYADLIRAGQAAMAPEIMNVSVVGGFVFSDTPKNGVAVIVTARNDPAPARRVAAMLARKAWTERERFVRRLTPIERAVDMSLAASRDPDKPALIYSDAGDNPGGGGRGNTTWLLAALHEAGATGVILGNFIDPALVAEAHARGAGANFEAVFNREGETEFSRRFSARATVRALHNGKCIGRRGLWQGKSLDLGPSAALDLGGVTVVVGTMRKQCADPVFFEMMGLDIASARTVVVKSRGHFRAGFDEFFRPEQVFEVDTAGLTSPAIERIPFRNLKRPVFPLDTDAVWDAPAWA